MTTHPFVNALAQMSFENCFNPYADSCQVWDYDDSAARRSDALSGLMWNAADSGVDALWIGRDLGYRGGRRTGLALTDDIHLENHCARWGITMSRPTRGAIVAERTAAIIWKLLDRIESRVFLWNVFPLHPHEPEDPFSNRQHNSSEKKAGEAVLAALVELIRPKLIVAIGNDAAKSAYRLASTNNVVCVRHPSYGGQSEFSSQIASLYGVHATTPDCQRNLFSE